MKIKIYFYDNDSCTYGANSYKLAKAVASEKIKNGVWIYTVEYEKYYAPSSIKKVVISRH